MFTAHSQRSVRKIKLSPHCKIIFIQIGSYFPCHFDWVFSFSYFVSRKYKNDKDAVVIRFSIKLYRGMKEFNMCSVHEKFQSFAFEFFICKLWQVLKNNRLIITKKSEILFLVYSNNQLLSNIYQQATCSYSVYTRAFTGLYEICILILKKKFVFYISVIITADRTR
jgi:hypothetical protein